MLRRLRERIKSASVQGGSTEQILVIVSNIRFQHVIIDDGFFPVAADRAHVDFPDDPTNIPEIRCTFNNSSKTGLRVAVYRHDPSPQKAYQNLRYVEIALLLRNPNSFHGMDLFAGMMPDPRNEFLICWEGFLNIEEDPKEKGIRITGKID